MPAKLTAKQQEKIMATGKIEVELPDGTRIETSEKDQVFYKPENACHMQPVKAIHATFNPSCPCATCQDKLPSPLGRGIPRSRTWMIVCEHCGNKRCPHATHHDNPCTGSNDPGQPGSRYGGVSVDERTRLERDVEIAETRLRLAQESLADARAALAAFEKENPNG